jgi:Zinc finger, C3HC4 type (RING finger)
VWPPVNIPILFQILQRHKNHLAQHQQSLTCQICLDLMHKPFALAPCGHITCYNCLIRWFTALQNSNATGAADDNANPLPENVDEVQLIVSSTEATQGTYLRRRKTCPVCRATVLQRPVEMWGIKSMVVTLVNSKLADLPVPIAPPNSTSTTPGRENNNDDANNDPWRNIFYPTNINARLGPLVQNQADRENMGMYDNEDGGIYRCIDCLHEIWDGVCSGCNRGYPGHEGEYEDNDDNDSDLLAALDDVEPIPFWGGENGNFIHHPMLGHLFMSSDEGMTDSEEDDDRRDMFFDAFQPAFFGQPALEGIARVDEISDEHDSDYGGSFIDDNEEGEGENMDDGQEVIELNDASSDEEHSHSHRLPHARTRRRRRPLVTSEDGGSNIDTDDEEANNIPAILARFSDGGPRELNGRRVFALLTDDSRSSGEEHGENEEEEPAQEDVLFRSQAYWSSGDEHDEDEEGEELAPEVLFRSRARPRWVWSDEE